MNTLSTKPTESVGPLGSAEKNKQWQRELLMERLRSRSNQHKTFPELSKSMRMSMLEKRYALDAVEKSNLQKCLDSMQHCIKVTTRQGLVERLESLSRQLGLKFMEDTSGLFISSDMFYLEIILDHSGTLSDVKVHHECKIEQQSCSELVTCLLKGDFSDFTVQLEGLSSIYQLNAEPKVKSKAFIALQAMETDIYNLFSIQTFHKDAQLLLLESSVGVVQKRRGGHPMRLTYFVSPYDLLSFETKCIAPLTIDLLTTKNLGMSVTLNLEASSANKIQIAPTVTFNQDSQGSSIPIYSPLTSINSTLLPATFVLRLNKSLPVCESLRQSIVHSSENLFSDSKPTSIMQLIVQTASEGQIQNSSKGLFVSLPDQNHCYFFTESKQMKGFIITNLPFTEPSQVPKILSILRRQARFYTLLASCVRPQGKMMDLDTTTMLEVNATSIYQISVALQHPFEESMATVEFDLNDPINVTCRLYSLTNNFEAISVKLSKIAQKSLSIPVTIRALLKFWEQERMKVFHRGIENGNFNLPLGPTDPGGRGSEIRDMKVKTERGINGSFSSSSRQFFHPSGVMMSSTDTFSENNVNMFAGPNENVMMNQFAMKANNDLNFTDIGAIKNYSAGEDFCRSPKSNIDLNCQNFSETSDSSSLGTSTPSSDSGVAASCFQKTFQTNTNDSSSMNNEIESDKILKNFHVENDNKSNQEIWKDDNENSTQVPTNNTLSGIAGMETNSALSGMRLDRHPAIEIIPITTTANQNVSASSSVSSLNSNKHDKKSLIKKGEDKSKIDKKRKRKKGDSPMGPPEKLISKQDSLNRQFNNSVKNFEMSPNSPSCLARKYSPGSSPKLNQSNSSKPSPKNSPVYNSPKHLMNSLNSPKSQYGITSPKHGVSGSTGKPSMSALKSATNSLSPKSEKCKMSYRDKEKDRSSKSVSNVNSSKIKASSVKLKQIDLSAAFLTHGENSYNDLCLQQNPNEVFKTTSPTGGNNIGLNSNVNNVCKVRKGSLSAVIDKLKSAQNSGDDFLCNNLSSTQKLSDSDGGLSVTNSLNEKSESFYGAKAQLNSGSSGVKANTSSSNPSINSEYQIKPSLDGMKITINKTRSKDASSQKITSPPASKAQTAGNNSPKKLSSLKAGGAASAATKKYSNKTSNSQGQTLQGKGNFQKSNSSGNLAPTKSSSSGSFTKSLSSNSFSTTDLLKKDKISKAKSANADRAPNSKHDPTDVMKILRYASPKSAMEGFMKSLNTKFQIPKLSARAANDDSKKDSRSNSSSAPTTPLGTLNQSPPIPGGNNCNNETAGKSLPENLSKNKYPFSLGKSTSDCVQSNIPNTFGKISNYMSPNAGFLKDLNPLPKSDSILNTTHQKNQVIKPLSSSTPSTPMHMTFSPFTSPHSSVLNSAPTSRSSSQDTSSFQNQSVDVSMRPPSAPCAVDMSKTGELDLSIKSESKLGDIRTVSNVNSVRKVPGHKMSFPPSPSVSLHIVKSPVPSPLMVMPSPHSNSPCITDDELMDEALVGITGK